MVLFWTRSRPPWLNGRQPFWGRRDIGGGGVGGGQADALGCHHWQGDGKCGGDIGHPVSGGGQPSWKLGPCSFGPPALGLAITRTLSSPTSRAQLGGG